MPLTYARGHGSLGQALHDLRLSHRNFEQWRANEWLARELGAR